MTEDSRIPPGWRTTQVLVPRDATIRDINVDVPGHTLDRLEADGAIVKTLGGGPNNLHRFRYASIQVRDDIYVRVFGPARKDTKA